VLAHKKEETILASHIVRLLEEDADVIIPLLETFGTELSTLQTGLFPTTHPALPIFSLFFFPYTHLCLTSDDTTKEKKKGKEEKKEFFFDAAVCVCSKA
jgi:hypothetical protein